MSTLAALSGSRLRSRLRRFVRKAAVASCPGLVLPDGMDGFVHIETALLRPEGIYLLETLEGEGSLLAGERMPEWTLSGARRFVFPNPLTTLEVKMGAARLVVGAMPLAGFLILDDRLALSLTCPKEMLTFRQLLERLPPLDTESSVLPPCTEAWDRLIEATRRVKE